MNDNERVFQEHLDIAYKQILDVDIKWHYIKEICNVSDSNKPSGVLSTVALGVVFYNALTDLGWTCKIAPFGWGGSSANTSMSATTEWVYVKQNKSIAIILGDAYTLSLPQCNLAITDSVKFDYNINDVVYMNPEFFGFFENTIENHYDNNSMPLKLFNCFMARPTAPRQLWLYELTRKNLLDQGNVSYRLADHIYESLDYNNVDMFEKLKNNTLNSIFDAEHEYLKSRVPFKNFDTTLEQAIVDSKVSIVIETEHEKNQVFLTEKTFRALLMPRPFMLFVPGHKVGVIEYLKKLGFETHDDLIDHSYNNIMDSVPRLHAMIDQLEKIKTLKFDQSLVSMLQNRADKNLALVKHFRKNLFKKYFLALDKIKQIS
jgi:hypothetical protein